MLKVVFITVTSLAGLAACATVAGGGSAGSEDAGSPPPIVRGEPFQLRVGEERMLAESAGEAGAPRRTTVRFVAVVGDSRCPRDVTCVWGGDAEVEIALRRGEDGQETAQEATVHLHTAGGPRMPREARALGLTLRLEALDPYPETSHRIAQEEYTATLVFP